MQKHITQVAEIIEASRLHYGEDCLTDSKSAATKVIAYIQYHFETVERIKIKMKEEKDLDVYNFQKDQLD